MSNSRYIDSALDKLRRIQSEGKFSIGINRKDATALLMYVNTLETAVRQIHQQLKRGEATKDHGPEGNVACIMDHLTDIPSVF